MPDEIPTPPPGNPVLEPLKSLYLSLEEKYYQFAEFLESHHVPFAKFFLEPIETRGFPSFPIFALIVLALLLSAFYFAAAPLVSSSGAVKITVLSDDGKVDGALVAVFGNGVNQTGVTSQGSVDFSNLPKGARLTASVRKSGFRPVEQFFVVGQKSSISFSLQSNAVSVTLVVLDFQNRPLPQATVSYAYTSSTGNAVSDSLQADFEGKALVPAELEAQVSGTVTLEGYDGKDFSFVADEGLEKRINLKVSAAPATPPPSQPSDLASLQVTTKDDQGSALDAHVQVRDAATNALLAEDDTSFGMVELNGLPLGASVKVSADADGFDRATASLTLTKDKSITLQLKPQAGGSLTRINVKDPQGNALKAYVAILEDEPGDFNFSVLKEASDASELSASLAPARSYYAVAYKTGFLPGKTLRFAAGDTKTLVLNPVTSSNSGNLTVAAKDEDGLRISDSVALAFYDADKEWVPPFNVRILQGSLTLQGLPRAKYTLAGSYKALSGKVSADLSDGADSVNLSLLYPRGTLRVYASDFANTTLTNFNASAYFSGFRNNSLHNSCLAANAPSCDLEVRVDKTLNVTVTAPLYRPAGKLFLAPGALRANNVTEYDAVLVLQSDSSLVYVKFNGLEDGDGNPVTQVTADEEYQAKFSVYFADGVTSGGVYLRLNSPDYRPVAYIVNTTQESPASVNGSSVLRGNGNFSGNVSSLICTADVTGLPPYKMASADFQYAFTGSREVGYWVRIDGAPGNITQMQLNYRAYVLAQGKYFRAPYDAVLGNSSGTSTRPLCAAALYTANVTVVNCGGFGQACCSSTRAPDKECSLNFQCLPSSSASSAPNTCQFPTSCGSASLSCTDSGVCCLDGGSKSCKAGSSCTVKAQCDPLCSANSQYCDSSSAKGGAMCKNVACGGLGQACCGGTDCRSTATQSLTCNTANNTCQSCGLFGQQCCAYTPDTPAAACASSLQCSSNACASPTYCGSAQNKCTGASVCCADPDKKGTCVANSQCNAPVVCSPTCGQTEYCDATILTGPQCMKCDAAHCPLGDNGGMCDLSSATACKNPGYICTPNSATPGFGTCTPCGTAGQSCCGQNSCQAGSGLTCDATNKCIQCGALAQSCCTFPVGVTGNACNSALTCDATGKCASPILCGKASTPCLSPDLLCCMNPSTSDGSCVASQSACTGILSSCDPACTGLTYCDSHSLPASCSSCVNLAGNRALLDTQCPNYCNAQAGIDCPAKAGQNYYCPATSGGDLCAPCGQSGQACCPAGSNLPPSTCDSTDLFCNPDKVCSKRTVCGSNYCSGTESCCQTPGGLGCLANAAPTSLCYACSPACTGSSFCKVGGTPVTAACSSCATEKDPALFATFCSDYCDATHACPAGKYCSANRCADFQGISLSFSQPQNCTTADPADLGHCSTSSSPPVSGFQAHSLQFCSLTDCRDRDLSIHYDLSFVPDLAYPSTLTLLFSNNNDNARMVQVNDRNGQKITAATLSSNQVTIPIADASDSVGDLVVQPWALTQHFSLTGGLSDGPAPAGPGAIPEPKSTVSTYLQITAGTPPSPPNPLTNYLSCPTLNVTDTGRSSAPYFVSSCDHVTFKVDSFFPADAIPFNCTNCGFDELQVWSNETTGVFHYNNSLTSCFDFSQGNPANSFQGIGGSAIRFNPSKNTLCPLAPSGNNVPGGQFKLNFTRSSNKAASLAIDVLIDNAAFTTFKALEASAIGFKDPVAGTNAKPLPASYYGFDSDGDWKLAYFLDNQQPSLGGLQQIQVGAYSSGGKFLGSPAYLPSSASPQASLLSWNPALDQLSLYLNSPASPETNVALQTKPVLQLRTTETALKAGLTKSVYDEALANMPPTPGGTYAYQTSSSDPCKARTTMVTCSGPAFKEAPTCPATYGASATEISNTLEFVDTVCAWNSKANACAATPGQPNEIIVSRTCNVPGTSAPPGSADACSSPSSYLCCQNQQCSLASPSAANCGICCGKTFAGSPSSYNACLTACNSVPTACMRFDSAPSLALSGEKPFSSAAYSPVSVPGAKSRKIISFASTPAYDACYADCIKHSSPTYCSGYCRGVTPPPDSPPVVTFVGAPFSGGPRVSAFGIPYTQAAQLSGYATDDWGIVRLEWGNPPSGCQWSSGPTYTPPGGTRMDAGGSITCTQPGAYTLALTATDNHVPAGQTTTGYASIIWTNNADQPPTVTLGGPYSGAVNALIPIQGTASDDKGVTRLDWTSTPAGCTVSPAAQTYSSPSIPTSVNAPASIQCTAAGSYTVTLTATDTSNQKTPQSATVTVTAVPADVSPSVSAPSGLSGAVGADIPFSATATDDKAVVSLATTFQTGSGCAFKSPAIPTGLNTKTASITGTINCASAGSWSSTTTATDNYAPAQSGFGNTNFAISGTSPSGTTKYTGMLPANSATNPCTGKADGFYPYSSAGSCTSGTPKDEVSNPSGSALAKSICENGQLTLGSPNPAWPIVTVRSCYASGTGSETFDEGAFAKNVLDSFGAKALDIADRTAFRRSYYSTVYCTTAAPTASQINDPAVCRGSLSEWYTIDSTPVNVAQACPVCSDESPDHVYTAPAGATIIDSCDVRCAPLDSYPTNADPALDEHQKCLDAGAGTSGYCAKVSPGQSFNGQPCSDPVACYDQCGPASVATPADYCDPSVCGSACQATGTTTITAYDSYTVRWLDGVTGPSDLHDVSPPVAFTGALDKQSPYKYFVSNPSANPFKLSMVLQASANLISNTLKPLGEEWSNDVSQQNFPDQCDVRLGLYALQTATSDGMSLGIGTVNYHVEPLAVNNVWPKPEGQRDKNYQAYCGLAAPNACNLFDPGFLAGKDAQFGSYLVNDIYHANDHPPKYPAGCLTYEYPVVPDGRSVTGTAQGYDSAGGANPISNIDLRSSNGYTLSGAGLNGPFPLADKTFVLSDAAVPGLDAYGVFLVKSVAGTNTCTAGTPKSAFSAGFIRYNLQAYPNLFQLISPGSDPVALCTGGAYTPVYGTSTFHFAPVN